MRPPALLLLAPCAVRRARAVLIETPESPLAAGETCEIRWSESVGVADIDLKDATEPGNLRQVEVLATGVWSLDNGTGWYSWPVPRDLDGEIPYALQIRDRTRDVTYLDTSETFRVEGGSLSSQEPEPSSTFAPTESASSPSPQTTSSVTPAVESTESSTSDSDASGALLSSDEIVGVAFGAVVGTALAVAAVVVFVRRRRRAVAGREAGVGRKDKDAGPFEKPQLHGESADISEMAADERPAFGDDTALGRCPEELQGCSAGPWELDAAGGEARGEMDQGGHRDGQNGQTAGGFTRQENA